MNKVYTDQPGAVRHGEELNHQQVEAYLKSKLKGLKGDMQIRQFGGGASNLTYLISFDNRELVMRRPPFGANIKSAHDMGREFRVLDALSQYYDKVPKPLLFDTSGEMMGVSFYVMERVNGVILRGNDGASGGIDVNTVQAIAHSLIRTIAELHDLDYQKVGLGDLGRPAGYVERQVVGWSKRYDSAQTDQINAMTQVSQWLLDQMPKESGASIIHNDFKHDNVVLDKHDLSKVRAILDWEMCTVGDPLMDIGTVLAYWINPEDHTFLKKYFPNPTALKGNPRRSEVVALYEKFSGRSMDNPVFYYVFGLYKTAVILQQIYARYKKGYTKDQRFAQFNLAVAAFGMMAQQAISKDRLDDLM